MGRTLRRAKLADLSGEVIGVSDWVLIDQDRIDRFADLVDDHLFIHVDPVRAAQTAFGGTIAHGFLTLSLMTAFMATADLPEPEGMLYNLNYGTDRLRFLSPVHAGSRVRAVFREVSFVEKRPGEWIETREMVVEIEGGDRPALTCEWMTLCRF